MTGGRAILLVAAAGVVGPACRNFEDAPPPRLAVSPPTLAFSAVAGGLGPPGQAVTVDAIGGGPLAWAASTDAPWLSLSPASGTAPTVTWAGAASAALAPGSYAGAITVVTTAGPPMQVTVPVTLAVATAVSLTGRWAGATDTVTIALQLSQADTVVTGSGTLNPPLTTVRVTGVYRYPAVALTLTAPDSTVTTFVGSLVNDHAFDGVLNGGRLVSYPIAVFRQ